MASMIQWLNEATTQSDMRSSTVSIASLSCSQGAVLPSFVTTQRRRFDTLRWLQQLICLVFLAAVTTASGQLAPVSRGPLNEPLEKYDNPPAPLQKMETSPQMISQFGVFTSYQVNVDQNGQNILGDAANECAISVDPT